MKKTSAFFAGLMVIALLCMAGIAAAQEVATVTETTVPATEDTSGIIDPDDIPPYNGPIGADSPLYGLKLALEDLDESFTTNESERVDKQMKHARLRLSEVRRELAENRTDSAQQALEQYWQKVNITQMSLAYFGSNQTGLMHAQEMHFKHQSMLEDLMFSHPNNTGLARAYNNSLRLEQKFEEKTQVRFEKVMEKNNRTIVKAFRLEVQEEHRAGGTGVWNETEKQTWNEKNGKTHDTTVVTPQQTPEQQDSKDKSGHGKSTPAITASPEQSTTTPSETRSTKSGEGHDDNKGSGNGNNDMKGNSNSRGK